MITNDTLDDIFPDTDIDILEEYALNEYATAKIVKDVDKGKIYYHIDEPDISAFQEEKDMQKIYYNIRSKLNNNKRIPDDYDDRVDLVMDSADTELRKDQLRDKVSDRFWSFIQLILGKEYEIDESLVEEVMYYVKRDLIDNGKVQPIMEDPNIEDIHINGPDKPLFVYHSEYLNIETTLQYEQDILDNLARSLTQKAGKHVSKSNPSVQGSLLDGSRIQISYKDEISADGTNITIRLFDDIPLSPIQLVNFQTFTAEEMAYLWLVLENEKSVMFVGGTGAGKTTSMNASSLFIPENMKIVSIEDTREIQLPHKNWIKQTTRESAIGSKEQETMYDLLTDALRQRPNFILVGEVRGKEAETLFQAMNTGHATLSTLHAETASDAINRMKDIEGTKISPQLMAGLDVICVQTRNEVGGEKIRRLNHIKEINGVDTNGKINLQTVFDFDEQKDQHVTLIEGDESKILKNIRRGKGEWDEQDIIDELAQREELIEEMIAQDVMGYEDTYKIIKTYSNNKEKILDHIDDLNKLLYDDDLIDYDSESNDNESDDSESDESIEESDKTTKSDNSRNIIDRITNILSDDESEADDESDNDESIDESEADDLSTGDQNE